MKLCVILLLIFSSCSILEDRRSRPYYDKKFNTLLFGSWKSTDTTNDCTFHFDYGDGTKGFYDHYEFVWKSNNSKVTYSRFYSSGWFSEEYWSEDRYMTFTFIDTNHIKLKIEENEFDPEGDPVPETFILERVYSVDERFLGTWDLESVFRDTNHHQSLTFSGFVNKFAKNTIIPANLISDKSNSTLEYGYSVNGSNLVITEFKYDNNYDKDNLDTVMYTYTFIKDQLELRNNDFTLYYKKR